MLVVLLTLWWLTVGGTDSCTDGEGSSLLQQLIARRRARPTPVSCSTLYCIAYLRPSSADAATAAVTAASNRNVAWDVAVVDEPARSSVHPTHLLLARQTKVVLDALHVRQHSTVPHAAVDATGSRRFVLFSFSSFRNYGFGASFRHLRLALDYALATDRLLLLADRDTSYRYGGGDRCTAGILCHMYPPSGVCTQRRCITEAGIRYRSVGMSNETTDDQVVLYSAAGRSWDEMIRVLGPQRATRDPYWAGLLQSFLWHPRPHVQRLIDEQLQRLDRTRHIVGLHVRQGDKMAELNRRTIGVDTYLSLMNQLLAHLPDDGAQVFLATDTEAVIHDVVNGTAAPLLRFPLVWRDEQRRSSMHRAIADGEVSPDAAAMAAIVNVHVLAHTDTLICLLSSKFCALAGELQLILHPAGRRYDVMNGTFAYENLD